MLPDYCKYTLQFVCLRLLSRKLLKCYIIFAVFYIIFNSCVYIINLDLKVKTDLAYFVKKGLHIFSESEYILVDESSISKQINNKQEVLTFLQRKFQTTENIVNANGLVYILETEFPADPIEGFRRFVSLQRLFSSRGYLTVLPEVENGLYYTLNCTYRTSRVRSPLPIESYFNIEKLQSILASYSLHQFISSENAVSNLFPKVTIVLFVYNNDIVEIPNPPPPTNSGSKKWQSEFSYVKSERILRGNYTNDCGYFLKRLSVSIMRELIKLNNFNMELKSVICVNAMLPVSLHTFFRELDLDNNGSTIVFVNWRGYQDTTQTKLDTKLTLNHTLHDHILIIPMSDMVTRATKRYLASMYYPLYSYSTAVIDLKYLHDLKMKLSVHEFNVCVDKLYYTIRFKNHGYYSLVITNAFHPFSLEFDSYPNSTLFEYISAIFSHGLTPMVTAHNDLFPQTKDMGLSYLVDVNLVRYSAAVVIFSDKSNSRSIYSYYYDSHVGDFSTSFQIFDC